MGRYSKDIQLEQPIDVVSMVMEDFMYHNRFSRTDWNGEMVYYLKDRHKKERYMKWVYVDGRFHVEAWLKNSFGGETDLDGLGGGASRKEFRASIDGLIETLKKTAAGSLAGGHIGSDPLHHDGGHGDNHDVWRADTRWQQNSSLQGSSTVQAESANKQGTTTSRPFRDSEANAALIFSVLALIFGWSFPILGIIFLVLARKKTDYSANPGLVRLFSIFAIVGIVLGVFVRFIGLIFASLFF